MDKKKVIRRRALDVPKDRLELEQFVGLIWRAEEKINAIAAEADGKIAELSARINDIKKKAQEDARPFEEEINARAKGVYIFSEGHRAELTEEKKKTIEFATGDKIRWYFPPPAVSVKDEGKAINELKRRGLKKFIRVKEEIDKEGILKQAEKIKGLKWLSVSQVEIFAIVLAAMGIELQKGERKFKKVRLS